MKLKRDTKFGDVPNIPLSRELTIEIISNLQKNAILSRTKTFKKTFFVYCINEWNNLNDEVSNTKSSKIFKKMIVTENKGNSLFSVYNSYGAKLLTRLRLQFSYLKDHKLRHGFGDTVSPMCGYNAEIEDIEHFLLRCHLYSIQRFEIFSNINKVDPSFTQLDTKEQVNILLYRYAPNKSNALNQDIVPSWHTTL